MRDLAGSTGGWSRKPPLQCDLGHWKPTYHLVRTIPGTCLLCLTLALLETGGLSLGQEGMDAETGTEGMGVGNTVGALLFWQGFDHAFNPLDPVGVDLEKAELAQ